MILNGWKEISMYLKCGVRTAQRWEACFGLPITRPGRFDGRGSVIAHSEDIDAWLSEPRRPDQLKKRIRDLEEQVERLKEELALATSGRVSRKTLPQGDSRDALAQAP